MVECISTWAKNIAIAVIISTLIMMILPDNKNKKYIKIYQRHEMQGINHENEKNKYYKK